MKAQIAQPLARRFAGAALTLALAAPLAHAQSHETSRDGYVLRGSTVSSENISPATAREHGIERGPGRGVLNVVVLRKAEQPPERTVPAEVRAQIRNAGGIPREVRLREVKRGDYVSYMGTYDFAPREVLDFSILAKPRGSNAELKLEFRDRMWHRQ